MEPTATSAGDVDRNGDVLSAAEAADLAFYVEHGYLAVVDPEQNAAELRRLETERWVKQMIPPAPPREAA